MQADSLKTRTYGRDAKVRQGDMLAARGIVIADDGHLLDIHGEQVKSPGFRI